MAGEEHPPRVGAVTRQPFLSGGPDGQTDLLKIYQARRSHECDHYSFLFHFVPWGVSSNMIPLASKSFLI